MKVKAVIFDMDGVIADTEPLHKESCRALLKELKLNVEEILPRAFARSKREFWAEVASENGVELSADELTKREFELLIGIIKRSGLKPSPGLTETLETLRERGKTLVVASSSDRVYVDTVLKITQTGKYFDRTVCGNEVKRAKPSPDVYLKALEICGITADEAVAVEDSDTGATAAVAAGIRCIGYDVVSDEIYRQSLRITDFKIKNMCELLNLIS
ncbi:MAG: HAD family hydrolase [Candidatus Gallimonas sp.]